MSDDTIAAISTPLGYGGIGIVRLSGKDAIGIADKVFRSPKNKQLKQTPSHRIIYGSIINPKTNEVIDEVLVSVMKAPNTYTKEDVVEINCHGGHIPLKRVLEIVLGNGARLAEPGEFTQRAFLNGRIDIVQAEAVLDNINALTEQSQKAAMEQISGRLSKKIDELREKLIELASFVEAYIDFPEDDIEALSSEDMVRRALKIKGDLEKLIDSSRQGLILREGLKTAIIGRPNVGKSSLLNALLERDRAIVTDMPGTTRDVIEEYLNINGIPVRIMDTAGIREARDIAEKEGVQRSIKAMEGADLVVLVLDGSDCLHDTDRELLEKSDAKNTVLAINKTDLPQRLELNTGGKTVVKISASCGTGLDELKNKIMNMALGGRRSLEFGMVTNIRHVRALERTLLSVNSFMEGLKQSLSPEFLSVELKEALNSLGEITGITTPEDILNKIFSDFCIGK
ncbi:MAG: tRNA uridine-5-carboxymethylaminomethyl(34) synthesis GTPase MnmE [Nitrospirae bacterium]|nr:tRNA uridine-5-carboxymethylaminomethyl(34) synthesis GTPase MnmE [Nitrospirota bacterium]